MIKLASFALVPLLAATFYSQPPSTADTGLVDMRVGVDVEEKDRQFLDELDRSPEMAVETVDRADREFLANLVSELDNEVPVMRAIPIERPAAVAAPAEEPVEVRRALPIATSTTLPKTTAGDLRSALKTPAIAQIAVIPSEARRASIVILGDQVVLRSKLSSLGGE